MHDLIMEKYIKLTVVRMLDHIVECKITEATNENYKLKNWSIEWKNLLESTKNEYKQKVKVVCSWDISELSAEEKER